MLQVIAIRAARFCCKAKEFIRYIRNYVNSVIFNFVYLPYKQAKKMPIWVDSLHFDKNCHYTGRIIIDCDSVYAKMIRLGSRYNSWYPDSGITLQLLGEIVFRGPCIIGNDSKIYVNRNCKLDIGFDVQLTASCRLICESGITINDFSRIGWNTEIIDTNFHYLVSSLDGSYNPNISSPIYIGKHNWIGANCKILKGFKTTDYVTIGTSSVCRGEIDKPYTVWSNEIKQKIIGEKLYCDLSKDLNMYNQIL